MATQLTPETKFRSSLAQWCVGAAFVVVVGWYARGQIEAEKETKREISALRQDFAEFKSDVVSQQQFERWASTMRYENKDKGFNVLVPEPRQFSLR